MGAVASDDLNEIIYGLWKLGKSKVSWRFEFAA